MNRRTFLKAVGVAMVAPGAMLGAAKAGATLINPASVFSGGGLGRWDNVLLIEIHPQQAYDLKVMTARNKYKHERWLPRHNRWLAKQGRPPIKYEAGETGTFGGVNWITTKK